MPEPITKPPAPLSHTPPPAPSAPPLPSGPQTPLVPPPSPSKFASLKQFKLPPRLLALLPKLVIILVIVIVLVIAIPYLRKLKLFQTTIAPTSAPSASPLSTPTTELPSPYANDQEVLDVEHRLEALEAKLKIVNFREDTLHLPTLDWEVSFK